MPLKGESKPPYGTIMPSLLRFLAVIGILIGLGYAGLWALAHFVEPSPREMTVTIPQERLAK
jgi:hypothetical protein